MIHPSNYFFLFLFFLGAYISFLYSEEIAKLRKDVDRHDDMKNHWSLFLHKVALPGRESKSRCYESDFN